MTTKMEAAFTAAGMTKAEVALNKAYALWRNQGGSLERARDLLMRAFEGRDRSGVETHIDRVSSPKTSRGQLDIGTQNAGAASEGEGHGESANPAGVALPVREPSAADRKASALAHRSAASAVLDLGWLGRDTTPGGPAFRDLRWRDLHGMAERQFTEGATHGRAAVACMMIVAAGKRLGEVDPDSKWIDDLKPETVRAISHATEAEGLKPMLVNALKGVDEWLQHSVKEITNAQ